MTIPYRVHDSVSIKLFIKHTGQFEDIFNLSKLSVLTPTLLISAIVQYMNNSKCHRSYGDINSYQNKDIVIKRQNCKEWKILAVYMSY